MVAASLFLAAGQHGADARTIVKTRDLLLDVVVNGVKLGLLGEFSQHDGKVFARRAELDSLGFRLPSALKNTKAKAEIALESLPGVHYRVDETTQTIFVTAPDSLREPTELETQRAGTSALPIESGTGAVANYELVATHAARKTFVDLSFDGRVFSPWGVADSSFTATNARYLQTAPVIRLDSYFTMTNAAALTQYRVGDVISGGLSWTRPIRLGGFQMSTDFGIRPDLVTFPLPTISGQVAVPSSVDVLVNGVQQLSQPVPPGPFEIRQLPVVTGAGDVSIQVRDAAGQQTTQTYQLYTSRQLMAPGLVALSGELGLVRLNYGIRSSDYRSPAGSFSYRRGLTKWLTFEGHAEAAGGGGANLGTRTVAGGMAGGGFLLALGRYGVVSGNIAASRFARQGGGMAGMGFERIGRHVSFSATIQATQGQFRDVAADFGDPVPTMLARAVLGFSWRSIGTFGVAMTAQRRAAAAVAADSGISALEARLAGQGSALGFLPLVPQSKVEVLSMSYSRSLFDGRAEVSLTAFRDFEHLGSTGVSFALGFVLGHRRTVEMEADAGQSAPDAVVEATQSASEIGQTGFDVRVGQGSQSRQLATGTYRASWGVMDAGFDRSNGQTALRADLQGAIATEDGGVFASLPVTDSFAVVDTDGRRGVGVMLENRPVGATDSAGRLLVTDLRSFDANRINIDPSDVPMDAAMGPTTHLVRPRDRSGVVVHFPMGESRGALVVLHDAKGEVLPVGSRASLRGESRTGNVPVGYDGEAYVTGLSAQNEVEVRLPNGTRCAVQFAYRAQPGRLPRIGPLTCVAAAK